MVKEKRLELDRLKTAYVQRADEFLKKYFSNLVNYMLSDRNYFSQRGQLKRPNHEDIRYKFMTYALLVQYLKSLDKSCLGSLRKAYCSSLNLLMRREAREFAHELRSGMKASKSPSSWLEFSQHFGQSVDTSSVSDAYDKMLTVFIPLLDDESSFFATFMCFEVPGVVPSGTVADKNKGSTSEVETLNEFLHELLDGIQEDFYSVADYAAKVDPLRCVSLHGITEKHIPKHKAETVGICVILDDLDSRISTQFHRFVDDSCHQIEKFERSATKQLGVLPYIPRFGALATRLEQYVVGNSRDLVDQAYLRLVSVMFVTLDKIAQIEPKYADIVLIENYAAFQTSLYNLANGVPTLAKFYHQASEGYEQACSRHISVTIYYQFERLFQFARRIEDLLTTITPEEVHYQVGFSKSDLRKVVKSGLSGVDKSLLGMFKKLTKNITSEDLLPSLWDKCKKEFLDKYTSFAQLVGKVYPSEKIPPVPEMRDLLKSM